MALTLRYFITTAVIIITLFLYPVSCSPAFGDQTVQARLILDKNTSRYTLGLYIEYLEDKTGRLPFNEIKDLYAENRFSAGSKDVLNFGFSDSVYWLRLTLVYPDQQVPEQDWLIELAYPLIDMAQLYIPVYENEFKTISLGDTLPFHDREIMYKNLVFPIKTKAGQTLGIYLRIQSQSSVQIPLTLWTPKAFAEKLTREQLGLGLYFGMMLIMIFYNIFLLVTVKDKNYLFYIFYISSYTLFQASLNGLAYEYLWPEYPWWANRAVPFFMGIGGLWVSCFSSSFLCAGIYAPRLNKALIMVIAGGFITAVLSMTVRYGISIKIATAFSIFCSVTTLAAGLVCQIRGYRPARFFLTAWFIFLIGIIVYSLKTFGIFPANFITNYSIQIGSVMEVILLSLALADRINMERKEKLKIRQEALEANEQAFKNLEKANIIKLEYNEKLEKNIQQKISGYEKIRKNQEKKSGCLVSLNEISLDIISKLDLDELLNNIVSRAGKLTGCDHGFIYLMNESRTVLECTTGTGMFSGLTGNKIEYGKGLAGRIWETGNSMIINDYSTWSNRLPSSEFDIFKAVMGVPLISNQMISGVIGFTSFDKSREFEQEDLELLDRFARLASVALENARLYTAVHKAQEAAESANRAKSTFLANMSHELRTPLNAIIGYSEMLSEDARDMEKTGYAQDLEKIHMSGHHLLGLISEILDLSKIEAGKMAFCPEEFEIIPVINEIINTVQPLAHKNQNTLKLNYTDQKAKIYTDLTKFRQIILNLLTNACKFTENGRVELGIANTTQEGQPWFDFIIKDTGIGMNEEQLTKLFQPFSQAEDSTTRKYGGTGLGLAISKKFCDMMGGDIKAESGFGRGSVFTLSLPEKITPAKQNEN
ncbi:Two component system response regulator histidine kinase, 7TM-DISM domain-containing [Desulfonema limicola]|uniref:histidine kinase n=1 Tax=Desulfonema limicola TaxID=45656 RepID=A0A975GJY5_9BACT|nr:7TM diverse intracellular signaling domain-containing protein [Desulfonema limicola]QTA83940.1 Two component system response regulator histidine kinase, 7TM-DISM domain-containing [Desulfonema limicola]